MKLYRSILCFFGFHKMEEYTDFHFPWKNGKQNIMRVFKGQPTCKYCDKKGFIAVAATLITWTIGFVGVFLINNYKTLFHLATSECAEGFKVGRNPDGTVTCIGVIKIEPIKYPKVLNEELYE